MRLRPPTMELDNDRSESSARCMLHGVIGESAPPVPHDDHGTFVTLCLLQNQVRGRSLLSTPSAAAHTSDHPDRCSGDRGWSSWDGTHTHSMTLVHVAAGEQDAALDVIILLDVIDFDRKTESI